VVLEQQGELPMSIFDEISENIKRLREVNAQILAESEAIAKERDDAFNVLWQVAHAIKVTPSLNSNTDGCMLRVQITNYLASKNDAYQSDYTDAKAALAQHDAALKTLG